MGLILSLDNSIHSFNRAGFVGLLDEYTGAAAGYSLRRLSVNSTNVIRVRRSSDNAEADFTATEITDGTLLSWVGNTASDNGFVTTWYDQSGNSNDATQATAASQPKIVDAGVLVEENGKPALDFDGTDDYFIDISGVMGGSVNGIMISVHKTNDGVVTFDSCQISDSNPVLIPIAGNNQVSYAHLTNTRRIFATSDNFYDRQLLVIRQNYNSNHALYIDGSLIDSQTDSVSYTDTLKIGRVKSGGSFGYYNNNLQEIIVYPSDQSSNRTGIETNINNHYNIYP